MKKLLSILLSICMVFGVFAGISFDTKDAQAAIGSSDFLKANGKNLCNNYGNGEVVQLKGTNAGGYLIQEFWMTMTEATGNVSDENDIYQVLTSRFGKSGMEYLVGLYQDNYWTTQDFDNCAAMGMNCIRLPFWYKNILNDDGSLDFSRLDWFVQQAGQRGMYVILDFHGAPGSQNGSDHSGIDGGNNKLGASEFFFGGSASSNQQLYYDMWYKIAQHYAGNPTVAGYDLLNEPYCTYRYNSGYSDNYLRTMLWDIYNNAYNVIRSADKDHVIIMEATWDPVDLPNPSQYGWSNIMYEYHNYLYDDYDNAAGNQIANMRKKVDAIQAANYNVPSYMGEFCYFNNLNAWDQGLDLLTSAGINWTSWTYKVISDYGNWGLYNQTNQKANIETDSWDTLCAKFSKAGESWANTGLINVMKKYFAKATVSGGATSSSSSNTGSNAVTMYTDSNYGGTAVTFGTGEYNMNAMTSAGIPNDSISSIKVANGYEVIVYADINFGGSNKTFTGDVSYVGNDWNDQITSFKVISTNSDSPSNSVVISNGEYYLVATDSDGRGYVVTAENGGEDPLIANRDSCGGAWESLRIESNGDGTVALKSVANNKYVCAVIDENSQLLPRSSQVSTWEKFYLVATGDGKYGLKAVANGKYVCADFNNGGTLRAISDSVAGSWEAFSIYNTSDTSGNPGNSGHSVLVSDGEYYLVATDSDGYSYVVCAENGGDDSLIANRDSCGGAWESLKIENNGDGTVSLKSVANDNYVCAVIDENCQLLPRSSQVGTWEKFYLVEAGDGKYGLKAVANDKYVCADFNNGGILRAVSDSLAGSWEAFAIYSTSDASGNPSNNGTFKGVTMYTDSNYGGTAVTFGIGEYNMNAMTSAGIPNDSISSIKVPSGYKVVIYADIDFHGNNKLITEDCSSMASGWNDAITSFKVMDANGSYDELSNGEYYFSAVNSNGTEYVVCAENEGNDALVANRNSCGGAWETLTIVNNSDGTISLKSNANGKYVCAVIDENNQLLPRSSEIGTWEKFNLVHNGDGTYSLKAVANGKYVCADFNNGGTLRAISDSVAGSWEAFYVHSLN